MNDVTANIEFEINQFSSCSAPLSNGHASAGAPQLPPGARGHYSNGPVNMLHIRTKLALKGYVHQYTRKLTSPLLLQVSLVSRLMIGSHVIVCLPSFYVSPHLSQDKSSGNTTRISIGEMAMVYKNATHDMLMLTMDGKVVELPPGYGTYCAAHNAQTGYVPPPSLPDPFLNAVPSAPRGDPEVVILDED